VGFKTAVALSIFGAVQGARVVKRDGSNATASGQISHLFTWGAPHPSHPKMTSKNGGCFNGYRIINFDRDWFVDDEDIVPTLLTFTKYNHPHVKTLAVTDTKDPVKSKWSCGDNPLRYTNVRVSLHDKGKYMSNMERLNNNYDRAKVASKVGLWSSYESDLSKVRANAQTHGWNLVGVAKAGDEDVSYLIQETSTRRCILTFEGSDSFNDWVNDIKIFREDFCGLDPKVHNGFRTELRFMVKSSEWQSNIRSKLGKCSDVDVVGHSLGGAVATLFAGCANSQNGSEDYNDISWNKESTALIRAV